MTNEQFEEQCTAFALNALSEEEQQEFRQSLSSINEEQKNLYNQIMLTTAQLAASVDPLEPDQSVKSRLIDQISEQSKPNNIFSIRTFAFAAAAIIIAVFSVNFFQTGTTENQFQANGIVLISHEVELPESFCVAAKEVKLHSSHGDKSASVIWCEYHNLGYLKVNNLEKLTANKSYQVWMLDENSKNKSIGVIKKDDTINSKVFEIRHILNLNPSKDTNFMISIEDGDGSKDPKGESYLVSS